MAKIKTMLNKKSLTVIGDNLECSKVKGCLRITCPPHTSSTCWGHWLSNCVFWLVGRTTQGWLHLPRLQITKGFICIYSTDYCNGFWDKFSETRLKKECNRFILTMQRWFFYSYFSKSHPYPKYLQRSFDEPVRFKHGTIMNDPSFRGILFSQTEEQAVVRAPCHHLIQFLKVILPAGWRNRLKRRYWVSLHKVYTGTCGCWQEVFRRMPVPSSLAQA